MKRSRPTTAGFALVLTLLILSVLAIVAVSYLASMTSERATANAFANKARAEAAARAGADAAMASLRENLRAFPDSVTAWDATQSRSEVKQPDGSVKTEDNEGTSLYLRARATASVSPVVPDPTADNRPPTSTATVTDPRRNFVLPLVSGVPKGQARLVSEKASVFPLFPAADTDPNDKDYEKTSTDLNARRYAGDKQGIIGSPPGWTGLAPKPARAAWVEIKDRADNDPAAVTLSRYAFFVEDESFKAPVNFADSLPARGDNLVQYKTSGTPRPVAPTDLSLIGPLASLGDSGATADAGSIKTARSIFPAARFAEPRGPAQADNVTKATADALRYVIATDSGALNLSRHGSQRLNLNAAVPATTDQANTSAVQHQMDQLVATLRFHLPNLGQRFYRTSAGTDSATLNANQVTPDTQTIGTSPASPLDRPLIYFHKVAANLRDQLDADSVPTVIKDGTVWNEGKPLIPSGDNGLNAIWAQGKDAAPYIEECAVRYRGGPSADGLRYTLMVDYYVEVWNMSSRDVAAADLGATPFLRITNPTRWVADDSREYNTKPKTNAYSFPTTLTSDDPAPANASPSATRGTLKDRDYDLDLSGVTFKAGVATVLTTDPDFKEIITGAEAQSHVFICGFLPANGPGKRVYNGPMPTPHPNPLGPPNPPSTYNALRMLFSPYGTTTSSDYETEVTLGNANGYLDSFYGAIPTNGGSTSGVVLPPKTGPTLPLYGGSLRGNGGIGPPSVTTPTPYSSITGDPRTNNEQLLYQLYTSGNNLDLNSRYYNFSAHTLGLPDTDFVKPENSAAPWTPWPDYCLVPGVSRAPDAPAVVANGAFTSIGQLGDVYDPARLPTTFDNAGINATRGGGRTFRLGQRDDRYHGDPSGNPSDPQNPPAANRADGIPNSNGWAAWRLADIFDLSNELRVPGAINLNGIPRDNGAALRAALTGFKFQPRTPTTSGADPMLHGDVNLASSPELPTDANAATGLARIVEQVVARLKNTDPSNNAPAGPFFERGEFGELETGGKPIFGHTFVGSSTLPGATSTDLNGVDLNKATDRGREEVFRRLAEVVCTRGDTFTVHAVGQSLAPPDGTGRQRVASTQRLRILFRLVPKTVDQADKVTPFLPGSTRDASGSASFFDFLPKNDPALAKRFANPDRYDVEILQSSTNP